MYAYALIHFGNNPKYLELEIYFIKNLQRNTVYDIIYLYSVSDTPQKYVDIIKSLSIKTVPYDDTGITYNITNFVSGYQHFNTLRTCNFIYAYKLLDYKKICIIESDMVIMSNIDNIFKFKCPSILYYPDKDEILLNHKVVIDKKVVLNSCNDNSYVNGGVLILKPSLKTFDKYLKNIKLIIKNNCIYPNETLFIYTNPKFYNLPITYNLSHYYINEYTYIKKDIKIYHFNSTQYKPIDIIRDKYIDKIKNRDKHKKEVVLFFKKEYYDVYYKFVNKLMKKI